MKDSAGNDELEAIRRWIRSLARNELLSAMEFGFLINEDASGGSHEYDLLQQMVQLQSPPPTPIHPRALSFKPSTCMGATDGRIDEERVRKNRFEQPRLFQFIERESSGCSGSHGSSGGKRRGSRSGQNHRSCQSKRFDVIARKFVTPWGEVLSIGCTLEEQQADKTILQGTGIKHGIAFGACKYGTFHESFSTMDAASTSAKEEEICLLNMLHVASRGKFLSVHFPPNGTTYSQCTEPVVSFCAPWLHPMSQWFSLPMYMASRYEVALWTAFRRTHQRMPASFPVDDALKNLSKEQLSRSVLQAVALALSTDILPADSASSHIRDTMLWHLFECRRQRWLPCKSASIQTVQSIYAISLIDLGSKVDRFRVLVQKHFQDALAQELQKDLVRSLTEEPVDEKVVQSPTRKRRSKKKKRIKQRVALAVVHEETKPGVNSSGEDDAIEDLSDECLETVGKSVESLVSSTPPRDRNRNTITVLALIDEVVETVFDQVGLNLNPSDQEKASSSLPKPPDGIKYVNDVKVKLNPHKREAATREEPICNQHMEVTSSSVSKEAGDTNVCLVAQVKNEPDQSEQQFSYSHKNSLGLLSPEPPHSQYGDPSGVGLFDIPSPSEFTLNFNDSFDGWERMNHYQSREKSFFTELFLRKEASEENQDDLLMASSTAASIASSSGIDEDVSEEVMDSYIEEDTSIVETTSDGACVVGEIPVSEILPNKPLSFNNAVSEESDHASFTESLRDLAEPTDKQAAATKSLVSLAVSGGNETPQDVSPPDSPLRSPLPQAPKTPPPQLSPILVSLADLKTLRRRTTSEEFQKAVSDTAKEPASAVLVAGSLPSSPVLATSNGLTPSWSREDLRISSFTDDQKLRRKERVATRQADAALTYRNAAAKSIVKSESSSRTLDSKARDFSEPGGARPDIFVPDLATGGGRRGNRKERYAQSEVAIDDNGDSRRWNNDSKAPNADDADNVTTTKDGSTTISSALSPQGSEDVSSLREERNSFRDMCLTLGAEVAMLKNLLAVEKGSKFCFSEEYSQGFPQVIYGPPSYDPDCMPPFFRGIPTGITSNRTVAALSDAGIHRGDYESIIVSEDGTDVAIPHENINNPRAVNVHRMSSTMIPGSDTSIDHTLSTPNEFRPLNREAFGSVPSHGLHSRLTKDIMNFLNATSIQLRKQAGRRRLATERLSRLITALWPRAQVKLYGSHVTGNCLPSSDLDFVICLPAVHKNAPAVAPGVLEGRNAINESSQKLLARKLKSESWIDPNSIKIIERTAVPIIKVSTKDTRARVLQLDISFDGPEHHGVEAIDLVAKTMLELPMIRPLMLVLKQFLLDRGLLTAFSGGLSSYGLFLMITRYLQEQPSSWGDCGSLLMGFLDFYGNSFDPRATGISAGRRQYFSRTVPTYSAQQPMWQVGHSQPGIPSPGKSVGGSPEFLLRRHSFNEKAATGTNAGVPHGMRPPRFHPPSSSSPQRLNSQFSQRAEQGQYVPYDHVSKPYTFDPLFVEDPLSAGNNVGRNAFRIFQVQRAFSDCHRALVASLEWDIYSSADLSDGVDYPLLKCLLQTEDVVYELEEPR